MLAKQNIKTVALLPRKIYGYLPPVKDALGLKMPVVHGIPCECDKVYIGQSRKSINIRIEEHNIHTQLAQTNNQQ
jgi:hypothetical protein